MLLNNAPSYAQYLKEEVDTLESSISFESNSALQSKILRFLALAEIRTGAIKVERNNATRKTVIRVFNHSTSDLQEIVSADDEVSSKVSIVSTNKKVEIEFNS